MNADIEMAMELEQVLVGACGIFVRNGYTVLGAPPPDGRYLVIHRKIANEWRIMGGPSMPHVYDLFGEKLVEPADGGGWWQHKATMSDVYKRAQRVTARLNAADGVTIPRPDWAQRRGYWDSRLDFRTNHRTVHARTDGNYRVVHEATGHCPSGPCGMVERRFLVAGPAMRLADLKGVEVTDE